MGGTLNGETIADTAGVEFRPLQPSTQTTTITADSAAINADGVSTTLITVTVRDGNGNLMHIDLARVALGSALGELGGLIGQADSSVTAVLRAGTVAGAALISGMLDGEAIADTASVTFRPGEASTTHTTITADYWPMIGQPLIVEILRIPIRRSCSWIKQIV